MNPAIEAYQNGYKMAVRVISIQAWIDRCLPIQKVKALLEVDRAKNLADPYDVGRLHAYDEFIQAPHEFLFLKPGLWPVPQERQKGG